MVTYNVELNNTKNVRSVTIMSGMQIYSTGRLILTCFT